VTDISFDNGELYFLPLGGSGEFGSNLNLYGCQNKWLMVDCGMGFADETLPGVDLVFPDPEFIERRRKDLVGAIITHAHEDHIGAIASLWPRLRCPVYGTPFVAALLRKKFSEFDWGMEVKIIEVEIEGRIDLDPFDVEFISVAHSIPESSALAIRTPAGTILNTGDWKVDPEPVVGGLTNEKRFKAIGDEGVRAMIGDSTNATRDRMPGSELEVQKELIKLFGELDNRIVATLFSTNVARLHTLYTAAVENDRSVALVGRSLLRMTEIAKNQGYLDPGMVFLSDKEAMMVPRDKIVIICTGSQGEFGAALTRISANDHREIELDEGDHVIYSSFDIPSNVGTIRRIRNRLLSQGIDVITNRERLVHVSGHATRGQMTDMLQWVRPEVAVPVHGEHAHLEAHAELARQCQVPQVVVPENGTLIRLAPGNAEIVDTIPARMLALEGNRLVPMDHPAIRARERLMHTGHIAVTVVVDHKGNLMSRCQISAPGVVDDQSEEGAEIIVDAEDSVEEALSALANRTNPDDDQIEMEIRRAVNRFFKAFFGQKPKISVHLVRV